MTQEQAEGIANNWNYNDEYSFHCMDADKEYNGLIMKKYYVVFCERRVFYKI